MATPPVDLPTLKAFLDLDVDDTSEDAELTAMLSAATEAVEARVGPMVSTAVTDEKVYGRNGLVQLRTPVISVESMTWQGQPFDLTLLDVDLKAGIISNPYGYSLGVWWWSYPYVTGTGMPFLVSYTLGRSPVPDSLKYATMLVAEQMWKTQRGGTNALAARFGGTAEPVFQGFLWPNRAVELAAPYEQLAFA